MTRNSCVEKQIYERLPLLRRYVMSRLRGSMEQVEDIEFIRNGDFKVGYSIDGFMKKCALNEIFDYYKERNRLKRTHSDEYEYHFNIATKSPEKEYEIRMENETFMKRVEKLRIVYRKIIILLLFQNMKHCEIANTLGMPRATVSTHFLRIRRKLGDIHLNKVRTRK